MKVGTFRKFDDDRWGTETFSDQLKSQTLCDMAVIDTIQWVSMEEVWLFNVASLFNSMLCPLMTVYTWLMAWWYILDPNCTKLGVTQVWDLNFFFMSNSMNEILHETNPLFFNFGLFFFWQSYECLFPENCIKTFQISFYWCHLTLDYR